MKDLKINMKLKYKKAKLINSLITNVIIKLLRKIVIFFFTLESALEMIVLENCHLTFLFSFLLKMVIIKLVKILFEKNETSNQNTILQKYFFQEIAEIEGVRHSFMVESTRTMYFFLYF